jgi:hypothetical protein
MNIISVSNKTEDSHPVLTPIYPAIMGVNPDIKIHCQPTGYPGRCRRR